MLKFVQIKDLRANSFRRVERYPIDIGKVAAIKESIAATGVWENIVGRLADDGMVEIAYGHHRLVALQEMFPSSYEIAVNVRELTNAQMIQMMSRENRMEYGAKGQVYLETIESTLIAIREGRITLPAVSPRDTGPFMGITSDKLVVSRKSEVCQIPDTLKYTKVQIAQFLGWVRLDSKDQSVRSDYGCEVAFKALEMIEKGLLDRSWVMGIGHGSMEEVARGIDVVYKSWIEQAEREQVKASDLVAQAARAEGEVERVRLADQAKAYEQKAKDSRRQARRKATEFGQEASNTFREGRKSGKKGQGRGTTNIRRRVKHYVAPDAADAATAKERAKEEARKEATFRKFLKKTGSGNFSNFLMGIKRQMRELMNNMDVALPVLPYFEEQRQRDGIKAIIMSFREKLDRFEQQVEAGPSPMESRAAYVVQPRQLTGS